MTERDSERLATLFEQDQEEGKKVIHALRRKQVANVEITTADLMDKITLRDVADLIARLFAVVERLTLERDAAKRVLIETTDKQPTNISPFDNDPFCIVDKVFCKLYPDKRYRAQVAFDLRDGEENGVFGSTTFPTDGSTPEILVSCEAPYLDTVELFAHELAHVATGDRAGHNDEWEKAFAAIHQEYMRAIENEANDQGASCASHTS